MGIGVIYVLDGTPNLKTKTTPKFGGCEFLFVKNLMIKPDYFIDMIQTEARKAATR